MGSLGGLWCSLGTFLSVPVTTKSNPGDLVDWELGNKVGDGDISVCVVCVYVDYMHAYVFSFLVPGALVAGLGLLAYITASQLFSNCYF